MIEILSKNKIKNRVKIVPFFIDFVGHLSNHGISKVSISKLISLQLFLFVYISCLILNKTFTGIQDISIN